MPTHNSDNKELVVTDTNNNNHHPEPGPPFSSSSKPAADNTIIAIKHKYNRKHKIDKTSEISGS
jgi:hypothetical protein